MEVAVLGSIKAQAIQLFCDRNQKELQKYGLQAAAWGIGRPRHAWQTPLL